MAENHLKWYNKTLHQYLSNDEIKLIMQKSNWKAAFEIFHTWGWISFAFALVGFFPNPVTVIISLFILGGKQLACAIILHDCSHDSMFTSRKVNNFVGNWFGAYPILHDVKKYRPYHLQHHMHTGLADDPDLSLTKGYPTTAFSMVRKFFRDFFGLSGAKANTGVVLMQLGFMKYALNGTAEWLSQKGRSFFTMLKTGAANLAGPIAANLIMFGILFACGKPWLYFLWPGALLTTFNFSLRVRSMAEHSMVEDRTNPHKNTRTTYANFFERILFAPHHVNYHAEHHLCMGAPSYNLPFMHKLLLQRGYFNQGALEKNYWGIVKKAIVNTPPPTTGQPA
ncbi:MAG TPA: fatty acid desaturase family protein [Chitinophagales bacterium]|nr:fatty acid desaturase family protein [Chitinophagales bacterium]